ncbi:MAG: hypothetical protein GY845_35415 [Planctomycetes bacterium]|nr:hypothetical protein [Planctomycetota bacterium]
MEETSPKKETGKLPTPNDETDEEAKSEMEQLADLKYNKQMTDLRKIILRQILQERLKQSRLDRLSLY